MTAPSDICWKNRQAIALVAQLPDDVVDSLAILDYARQFVLKFLSEGAEVIPLRNDDGDDFTNPRLNLIADERDAGRGGEPNMRRKLTVEETDLVKATHEKEGEDGVVLLLAKLMGLKQSGNYHFEWHVEYEDNGEAWAELNLLEFRAKEE
jgi:hypothetical protein